eukprot:6628316-Prymnesium_polylepis.2
MVPGEDAAAARAIHRVARREVKCRARDAVVLAQLTELSETLALLASRPHGVSLSRRARALARGSDAHAPPPRRVRATAPGLHCAPARRAAPCRTSWHVTSILGHVTSTLGLLGVEHCGAALMVAIRQVLPNKASASLIRRVPARQAAPCRTSSSRGSRAPSAAAGASGRSATRASAPRRSRSAPARSTCPEGARGTARSSSGVVP